MITQNLTTITLHFWKFDFLPFLGIPYGHTGHVRFITCVDYAAKRLNSSNTSTIDSVDNSNSTPQKKKHYSSSSSSSGTITTTTTKSLVLPSKSSEHSGLLIISGGDGFEDFRSSGTNPLSDIAGREDSTNHLLLWQVWERLTTNNFERKIKTRERIENRKKLIP